MLKIIKENYYYLEYKIIMDDISLRDKGVEELVNSIEKELNIKLIKFSNTYFRPLFGNSDKVQNKGLLGTKYIFKNTQQYIRFDWNTDGELIKIELFLHRSEAASHRIDVKDKEISEILQIIIPILKNKLITSTYLDENNEEKSGDYFIIQIKDYIKKLKNTVNNNIYDETPIIYNKGKFLYSFRYIPSARLETIKNLMSKRNQEFDMDKFAEKNLITIELHKGVKVNNDIIYCEIRYFDRYGTEQSITQPLIRDYMNIKYKVYYYYKNWK